VVTVGLLVEISVHDQQMLSLYLKPTAHLNYMMVLLAQQCWV